MAVTAISRAALFGLLLAPGSAQDTQANLRATRRATFEEADKDLKLELDGKVDQARLQEFKASLSGTFAALPKNKRGNLNHATVRYLLHRFFTQRHSWYLKGLEPNGDMFHSSADLSEWVPEHLVAKLDAIFENHGLTLDSLAVLAAAIEDVVHDQAKDRLDNVYQAMEFRHEDVLNRSAADSILIAYGVEHLLGAEFKYTDHTQEKLYVDNFPSVYQTWDVFTVWLRELGNQTFTKDEVHFEEMQKVAVDVGDKYGSYNDKECSELKQTLMSVTTKAGRVRLSDFYNMSLHSHWRLAEKAEYLESMGALDRTGAANDPYVIMPNYLASRPNCASPTSMYDVCCKNECEDLMGKVEQEFRAPTANLDRLLTFMESLPSPTTVVPRKLQDTLSSRLRQVAEQHGGDVILHSRLFAQFMHHAFPNECPFPHESGTVDPLTPDEWMDKEGTLSPEDRKQYVDDCSANEGPKADAEVESDFHDIPWSPTEELLDSSLIETAVEVVEEGVRMTVTMMVFAALALALVALVHPTTSMKLRVAAQAVRQRVRLEALAILLFIGVAVVLHIVDTPVLVFLALVVFFYALTPRQWASQKQKLELIK